MGRISGCLWMVAALIGAGAAYLPGADPQGPALGPGRQRRRLPLRARQRHRRIPWQHASMNTLAFGMVVTIPVVGLALYLTGGSLSYIEPFLVCALLYAAFFFPSRWAWPLAIELILVAGTPLLYDRTRPSTPSCRATRRSPSPSSPRPG